VVVFKDEETGQSFAMEESIVKLMSIFNNKTNNEDSEVWIGVTGDTGTGKSLLAQWLAYIKMGKKIPIKNILFDKHETINRIIECDKYDTLICDEAISSFFNRSSMTKEGRLIAELSQQIRQKNLTIFLCLPDLLSLDSMIHKKLKCVINVYEDRQEKNGQMKTFKGNAEVFIEHPKTRQVTFLMNYLKAKKRNPLAPFRRPKAFLRHKGNCISENSRHPFYPVIEGEKAYREKKESVLKKYQMGEQDKPKSQGLKRREERFDRLAYVLVKEKGATLASKLSGLPATTLYDASKVGASLFGLETDSNYTSIGLGENSNIKGTIDPLGKIKE
jgi:hypothetical protein